MAFRIVAYAEAKPLAKRASDAAFDRVAVLNKIMSDYDPQSELSNFPTLPAAARPRESAANCSTCWTPGRRWRRTQAARLT